MKTKSWLLQHFQDFNEDQAEPDEAGLAEDEENEFEDEGDEEEQVQRQNVKKLENVIIFVGITLEPYPLCWIRLFA
jgi:hypothetical protein